MIVQSKQTMISRDLWEKNKMIKIEKTLFPLKDLVTWKRNPRTMDEAGKARLKGQLLDLKQYKPLLVFFEEGSEKGIVLGGNMRLTCMQELVKEGHKEFENVWISVVNAPTDKDKLKYMLSDNDSIGRYNKKELVDMIDQVPNFEADQYNIETGNSISIADLMDMYSETEEDNFDADVEAAKIKTPVSKIGTIWELGQHRLMCGSANDIENVLTLTGGASADMSFTDPPYNVNYAGRGKNTSNTILNDHMDEGNFRNFLIDTFAGYRVALKKDAPLYVCYASRTHREFEDALNANGFKVRTQIIWMKTLASMGWGDYRYKHEPILYCHTEGEKVPFYGDRTHTTEWKTKPTDLELLQTARAALIEEKESGTTVWKLGRESGYVHPTQKPIELISIALKNSTNKGDLVIDLFGGSGSTLMACQQLERRCYTMELDPKYVDTIVKRWEEFTGLKAKQLQ